MKRIKNNKMLAGAMALALSIGTISPAFADGLTTKKVTGKEVYDYWHSYETKATNTQDFYGVSYTAEDSLFESNPDLQNKNNYGKTTETFREDYTHTINTARKASGLDEVSLDEGKNDASQAGAYVNALNNSINHNPEKPEGIDQEIYDKGAKNSGQSNLAIGLDDPYDNVVKELQDADNSNNTHVGHRRGLLDPNLKTIGVGLSDGKYYYTFENGETKEYDAYYTNTQVVGQDEGSSTRVANADSVVAYPGEVGIAEFSTERRENKVPHSVHFGKNYDLSNASVRVTNFTTGVVYNYSFAAGNLFTDSKYYGNMGALVFGHDIDKNPGDILKTEVFGVNKNGVSYPVSFETHMISLEDAKFGEDNVTPPIDGDDDTPPTDDESNDNDNDNDDKPIDEDTDPNDDNSDNDDSVIDEDDSDPDNTDDSNGDDSEPDAPNDDDNNSDDSDNNDHGDDDMNDDEDDFDNSDDSDDSNEDNSNDDDNNSDGDADPDAPNNEDEDKDDGSENPDKDNGSDSDTNKDFDNSNTDDNKNQDKDKSSVVNNIINDSNNKDGSNKPSIETVKEKADTLKVQTGGAVKWGIAVVVAAVAAAAYYFYNNKSNKKL